MIVTSEAILLRSRKQGDSSRIVTLYTKDFGKLNVIAKGAREMRSPFASALQLFNHLSVVFYKKENRDLYLLSKAETITKMTGIQQSMEQLTAASKIVDLVQRAMHDEQPDAKLFELLLKALKHIAEDPPQLAVVVASYFFYHFAAHEGFAIQLREELDGDRFILNIHTGEIFEANLSAGSVDHRLVLVSAKALSLFRTFGRNAIPTGPVAMDMIVTDEVASILDKFLRAHIDTYRGQNVG
jgi:DNA repair protein RecO (recombination protein O)